MLTLTVPAAMPNPVPVEYSTVTLLVCRPEINDVAPVAGESVP